MVELLAVGGGLVSDALVFLKTSVAMLVLFALAVTFLLWQLGRAAAVSAAGSAAVAAAAVLDQGSGWDCSSSGGLWEDAEREAVRVAVSRLEGVGAVPREVRVGVDGCAVVVRVAAAPRGVVLVLSGWGVGCAPTGLGASAPVC